MKSINRIIKLLEFLSKNKESMGIKEISTSLDFPLSTTHRMLNDLKKKGYIYQDDVTKKYRIGLKILSLAVNLLNNIDIVKIAKPIIEDLSTKYKQLVYLSVLENNKVVCVDMVNNAERTKFYVQIGSSMPIHCAASAKAIVAYLEESEIDNILNSFNKIKFTPDTKLDNKEIKKEFSDIRKTGFAVCDQEMELGVKAFATPIFDRNTNIYASITIMTLKQSQENEKKFIKDLKKASNKISKLLGHI